MESHYLKQRRVWAAASVSQRCKDVRVSGNSANDKSEVGSSNITWRTRVK